MKKAVLLLSGGPDSTTLGYMLKNQNYEIHSISFNTGEKEAAAVKRTAKRFANQISKTHKHVNLIPAFSSLYGMFDQATNMPPVKGSPILSFGTGIILSLGLSYAAEKGATDVFYGVHKDDRFYRANTPRFFNQIANSASIETKKRMRIHTPFLNKTIAQIFNIAEKLEVPLHKTWSCGANSKKQCGKCFPCLSRRRAFRRSKIEDLTAYKTRNFR